MTLSKAYSFQKRILISSTRIFAACIETLHISLTDRGMISTTTSSTRFGFLSPKSYVLADKLGDCVSTNMLIDVFIDIGATRNHPYLDTDLCTLSITHLKRPHCVGCAFITGRISKYLIPGGGQSESSRWQNPSMRSWSEHCWLLMGTRRHGQPVTR